MSRIEFDAVVVGAGPAGSAAAICLATAGHRTLVLEKDQFPRHKVCGEFLSSDARDSLARLGAEAPIEAALPEKIDRGRVFLTDGREIRFRLPAPGQGISRFRFDDILAGRAQGAGAEVRFGERVTAIGGSHAGGFRIESAAGGRSRGLRARVVIGAWGRWDALDRALARRFLLRPGKFFGWSLDLEGDTSAIAGEVRLYFFPGGYCGLSRVEGGRANLGAVVRETIRRETGGWPAVLEHARRTNPALARDLAPMRAGSRGFLGTGPVFFTAKPPTERGMLLAGDSAGVIDPFSGEGQASALASGILAADTAARFLSGDLSAEGLVPAYERAWRARFARRFAWSAFYRRLALHPRLGLLAARTAGRPLIRLAMREIMR